MKLQQKTAVQNYIQRWMSSHANDGLAFVGMQIWTEPFNTTRPRVLNVDVYVSDQAQLLLAKSENLEDSLQAGLHEHFEMFAETEMRITFKVSDRSSTQEWPV